METRDLLVCPGTCGPSAYLEGEYINSLGHNPRGKNSVQNDIIVIDPETSTKIWSVKDVASYPDFYGNKIFFEKKMSNTINEIKCIDVTSNVELWSIQVSSWEPKTYYLFAGNLYIVDKIDEHRFLYCLSATTGQLVWQCEVCSSDYVGNLFFWNEKVVLQTAESDVRYHDIILEAFEIDNGESTWILKVKNYDCYLGIDFSIGRFYVPTTDGFFCYGDPSLDLPEPEPVGNIFP